MSMLVEAGDAAAQHGKAITAVGTGVYSLTSLPLAQIAAAISIVVSLVYLWGAAPRWFRTTRAFFKGVFKRDWSDWNQLSNQPMKGDD